MESLRITAVMKEPVVYYGDGMHLDGILSYAAFMDLPPETRRKIPPIGSTWAEDFDLPLERWFVPADVPTYIDDLLFASLPERKGDHKQGKIWGWKASAVHATWLCEDRYAVRRIPDTDAMTRYTNSPSVNLGAGQIKAVNIMLPARFAEKLHWYAIGNLTEIERLLKQHVRAVGKITGKGPGIVIDWMVEKWPHDWSMERNGWVTRVMPVNYPAEGYVAEASIRPPYHHQSRIITALRPDWAKLIDYDRKQSS